MVFPGVLCGCVVGQKRRVGTEELMLWIVMLRKTLETPLDCKEIKPVNPKGNQPSVFIGKTDAEVPILWPPDAKSWLIGKHPDAGKDWGQEEKGTTEDKMVVWNYQLNGHEFVQTLGDSEGQEAWRAAVHGAAKSWTWLSYSTTTTTIIINLGLLSSTSTLKFQPVGLGGEDERGTVLPFPGMIKNLYTLHMWIFFLFIELALTVILLYWLHLGWLHLNQSPRLL